jgi:hypothetical protein
VNRDLGHRELFRRFSSWVLSPLGLVSIGVAVMLTGVLDLVRNDNGGTGWTELVVGMAVVLLGCIRRNRLDL